MMDPSKRITVEEALAHPFLADTPPLPGGELPLSDFLAHWEANPVKVPDHATHRARPPHQAFPHFPRTWNPSFSSDLLKSSEHCYLGLCPQNHDTKPPSCSPPHPQVDFERKDISVASLRRKILREVNSFNKSHGVVVPPEGSHLPAVASPHREEEDPDSAKTVGRNSALAAQALEHNRALRKSSSRGSATGAGDDAKAQARKQRGSLDRITSMLRGAMGGGEKKGEEKGEAVASDLDGSEPVAEPKPHRSSRSSSKK